MTGYNHASSALTLLLLLTEASLLHLSTSTPITAPEEEGSPPVPTLTSDQERRSLQADDTEDEEELFKDVDPKTLAAVLLEALNRSDVGRRRDEDEVSAEARDKNIDARTMKGSDRDRDGREEIEMLLAAQGKERERQEEEERKKAQEEEEKMTEKVTSRTTSQMVQVQSSPENGTQGSNSLTVQGGNEEEEEEQLSPEELKSLETMMKEFPRLNTATKREPNQREGRGWSSYNEVLPVKGSDIAMTKKKLKWQEETQKGVSFPDFREGNFMNDFEDRPESNDVQAQLPSEQEAAEGEEPEEEEEEEEVLSPEEEEARAKAEQEEMMRQAAEAQRAKMEEEKLADIASDMLLRYMVKQNGNRKYGSSTSNAAEDKRSDEEQEAAEEEDLDPQTIDKLIEISSKLHLPADDVVDIISDVEKKKKKDIPPEASTRWQRPLTPVQSAYSSNKGLTSSSTNQNNFPISKQPSPAVNLLKSWFQEKSPTKSQDLWSKPLRTNQNLWSKPQNSVKQEVWFKSPLRTGYPLYPYRYPTYYQRKPYPNYYPIYFPPPPRPKPRYYLPKPALTRLSPMDDPYAFPPKRRYHSWIQPRLRNPPASLQQKPFYPSYTLPLVPRTFQPARVPMMPPQQKQFYFPAPASASVRNEGYYEVGKQADRRDNLEKYIQQILLKRPQVSD